MAALDSPAHTSGSAKHMELDREEYKRYGRQMILPGWGLPGQLALKASRVAIVGAGGLGCPVLQYLAGAGVGTIDVWDHDEVSVSNLHRQVLHTSEGAQKGESKAESAARAMRALNLHITVNPHSTPILPETALAQLSTAQIIVDCTDRPLTRYLLSDAAVRLGVPLVSGAAIADLGQWAVYGGSRPISPLAESSTEAGPSHHAQPAAESTANGKGDAQGAGDRRIRACYRCIWPKPLPGSAGRCEDVGVWGVITGMVGTGMAGEVVKLILGLADPEPKLQTMHLRSSPLIRSTRLRPARPDCPSCGPNATIGLTSTVDPSSGAKVKVADLGSVDYVAFCAGAGGDGDDWADYAEDPKDGDGGRLGRSGMDNGKGVVVRVDARELADMLVPSGIEGGRGATLLVSELDRGSRDDEGGSEREAEVSAARARASECQSRPVKLIDTRSETEFGICSIPGSINIPLAKVLKEPISALTFGATTADEPFDVVFVCRQGNDSRLAAEAVRAAAQARKSSERAGGTVNGIEARAAPSEAQGVDGDADTTAKGKEDQAAHRIMDVRGGLRAWGRDVDPDFPLYF